MLLKFAGVGITDAGAPPRFLMMVIYLTLLSLNGKRVEW